MSGSFWMQFSIAVCESAVGAAAVPDARRLRVVVLDAEALEEAVVPKRSDRRAACSSSIAIVTVRPFVAALAYFPIRTPALKLFVAKSASTADLGLVGESRRSRAPGLPRFGDCGILRLRVGHGDENPLHAPAVTMFSIAVIWPALSNRSCPRRRGAWAPSFFARSRSGRILTKNGFVASFVISPTLIVPCSAAAGPRCRQRRRSLQPRCRRGRRGRPGSTNVV